MQKSGIAKFPCNDFRNDYEMGNDLAIKIKEAYSQSKDKANKEQVPFGEHTIRVTVTEKSLFFGLIKKITISIELGKQYLPLIGKELENRTCVSFYGLNVGKNLENKVQKSAKAIEEFTKGIEGFKTLKSNWNMLGKNGKYWATDPQVSKTANLTIQMIEDTLKYSSDNSIKLSLPQIETIYEALEALHNAGRLNAKAPEIYGKSPSLWASWANSELLKHLENDVSNGTEKEVLKSGLNAL